MASARIVFDGWSFLLLGSIVMHLSLSPFTKVEESFNVQASHDLYVFGTDLASYDHREFPGVVPRTFLGAAAVTLLAFPAMCASDWASRLLKAIVEERLLAGGGDGGGDGGGSTGGEDLQGLPSGPLPSAFQAAVSRALSVLFASPVDAAFAETRIGAQLAARSVLGVLSWLALLRLRAALAAASGSFRAGALFALLAALQFHWPFYASRFLPNVLAGIPVALAYAEWMLRGVERDDAARGRRLRRAVALLAAAAAVLRCDLVLLLAPAGTVMLVQAWADARGRAKGESGGAAALSPGSTPRLAASPSFALPLLATGALAAGLSALVSWAFDSPLWGRSLWPEAEVLLFNGWENKSHLWGVEPFSWYLKNALPRALQGGTALALLGSAAVAAAAVPRGRWGSRRGGADSASGTSLGALLAPMAATYLFVLIYSLLPHKELRFLLPIVPFLTVLAATGAETVLRWGEGGAPAACRTAEEREREEDEEEEQEREEDEEEEEVSGKSRGKGLLSSELAPSSSAPTSELAPSPPSCPGCGARRLVSFLVLAPLVLSSLPLSALSTLASASNYPGGDALLTLAALRLPLEHRRSHELAEASRSLREGRRGPLSSALASLPPLFAPMTVHVGNLAATTGASRFLQVRGWSYDKTEGLRDAELAQRGFDVLVEEGERFDGYARIAEIQAYDGLRKNPHALLWTRNAAQAKRIAADLLRALAQTAKKIAGAAPPLPSGTRTPELQTALAALWDAAVPVHIAKAPKVFIFARTYA